MRKYRSWLMGFGIGIILGASMLQLILLAKDQAEMVAEAPAITREQLDEEAKKADLVLLTTEQLEAKLDDAVAAAQKKTAEDPVTPLEDGEGAASEPSVQTDEAHKAVTLYIAKGMNFSEVADKLEQLGVIEDADDFIDKAWSIETKLGIGTAVFAVQSTYRQIMTELTRNKEY